MFIKKFKTSMLYILLIIILFMISVLPIFIVYADTDGNELRVTAQPDKLVLQLGTDWAGVEFELKLDSGVFPVPVKTDSSGVLTMELGGSKTYTLTRLIAKPVSVTNPPESKLEPTDVKQPSSKTTETEAETIFSEEPDTTESATGIEPPNNSIPVIPLILFLSGLILAVVILLIMRAIKRRREYEENDDEYDDDE